MPVPGRGTVGVGVGVSERNWPSNAAPTGGSSTPSAPTGVTGTAGNASSVVSWTVPSSNGGSAIIDYYVEQSVSPFTSWSASAGGTVSTATSQTVTGLTNGVGYQFRVYAQNSVGLGAASSPSATVTPTGSASSNPSGFTPPTANVTNSAGDTFTLKYVEDFNRAVANSPDYSTANGVASAFDNLYGSSANNDLAGGIPTTISTYGPYSSTTGTWDDTSNNGHYDPAILSVAAGSSILRKHIRYVSPWPRVASILPRLATAAGVTYEGSSRDVWGGRFEIVWRCSLPIATYKVAYLLWPLSNTRRTADGIDADGEIDYPEGDLASGSTFTAYQHWQGQVTLKADGTTAPTEQTNVPIKINGASVPTVGPWYHTVLEWVPGNYVAPVGGVAGPSTPPRSTGGYCRFYLNDVLQSPVATTNVPIAPMHWSIQTETALSGSIDHTSDGYIEIDWIAYYKWEPGARVWTDPDT